MEWFKELINFLTDPSGIGFPMLIAAGLGVILYLMSITTKGWQASEKKISKEQSEAEKKYPFKPF
ncbi:MAG: hypothetical protein WCV50_02715 [Patescibacteria group bacterium]|jgi:hypothetical protein